MQLRRSDPWSMPLFFGLLLLALGQRARAETPAGLAAEEFQKITSQRQDLDQKLAELRATIQPDLWADAAIFPKGIDWALLYEEKLAEADLALIRKALGRCEQRLEALAKKAPSWDTQKGMLARGYVSKVDGSVQPFGVRIPANYDPSKPMRLDVVLHGSSRPVGLSELRFINRYDAAAKPVEQDFIELFPLGRIENCYRWSGETDVFEAIEAVCRHYHIDRKRIVLRGMSMGASGTWHLGLKHPGYFVALGPYCGYVDTHQFSLTPIKSFVKVGPLPPHQEAALHMIDSIDYAANAGVVPAIACMGEKDIFFDAHVLMNQAMAKEKVQLINLISPGTGHQIDPTTFQEQMRLIRWAIQERQQTPRHLRFVTWTLKYNKCHWLEVLGLKQHYAKAEMDATLADDGSVDMKEPVNVTRFVLHSGALAKPSSKLRIGGAEVAFPPQAEYQPRRVFALRDGKWSYFRDPKPVVPADKRPGLQGPIDDAFAAPFLCVRGTGQAWNPTVHAYSAASLQRFAYEWHRYFRGALPIKDDTAVTEDDVRTKNLILFGDPGSNVWIGKILSKLPISWTKDDLQLGQVHYSASQHAPVLIQPNPLPGAEDRYVVLNSGHSFHEAEQAINYLLFPRWGDWAVLKVGDKVPKSPSEVLDEKVMQAGYFDEKWRLPAR